MFSERYFQRRCESQGSAGWNVCLTKGPWLCFLCFPHQASRAKHDTFVDTPHVAVIQGDQTPCTSVPGPSIPPGPKDDPGLHRLEIRSAQLEQVSGA